MQFFMMKLCHGNRFVWLTITSFTLVLVSGCTPFMSNILESILPKSSPEPIEVKLIVKTEQGEVIEGAKIQFTFDGPPETRWTNNEGYARVEIPQRDDIDVDITKEGFKTSNQTMNLKADPRRTRTYRLEEEEKSPDQSKSGREIIIYPYPVREPKIPIGILPNSENGYTLTRPLGHFKGNRWLLDLSYENNVYHYKGTEISTGESLRLTNPQVSGNNNRKIYTWKNGQYKYQVIWQPGDPDFVRLQVFVPNGKKLVDDMLEK